MQHGATHMRAILLSIVLAFSITSAAHATVWGGLAVANDGWTKGYWNYSDLDQLKSLEASECRGGSSLSDTCKWTWVSDDSWAAAVYCVNGEGSRLGVSTF